MKNNNQKFSLIDIETTGSARKGQKIIEIAILNIDGSQIVEEFTTLINPEIRIPYFISTLTGISNEDVENAPKFHEIAKKIVEMTEGRIFVAHNVFFDYNFIRHEFADLGFNYLREKICTVQLARKYLPGLRSYSLGELSKELSISNSARHRALGDARATFELFKIIQQKMGSIDELLNDSKKLPLPPFLNREAFDELPQKIGVYYFYNSKNEILYIGKSLNIKKRVSQHFHPDLKRKKDIELKNQVARIDYRLFPHELAALIFECLEIKKYMPRYNFSLKRRKFPYALKLNISSSGVLEIICTHNDGTFHPLFAVKSKRASDRKIDSIYRVILGPFETIFERNSKIDLLVTTLGISRFNDFLEKIFYKKVPKVKDFDVPLMSNNQNHGFIKIQNFCPSQMLITNTDGEHSIYNIDGDPDIASMICHYLLSEE